MGRFDPGVKSLAGIYENATASSRMVVPTSPGPKPSLLCATKTDPSEEADLVMPNVVHPNAGIERAKMMQTAQTVLIKADITMVDCLISNPPFFK